MRGEKLGGEERRQDARRDVKMQGATSARLHQGPSPLCRRPGRRSQTRTGSPPSWSRTCTDICLPSCQGLQGLRVYRHCIACVQSVRGGGSVYKVEEGRAEGECMAPRPACIAVLASRVLANDGTRHPVPQTQGTRTCSAQRARTEGILTACVRTPLALLLPLPLLRMRVQDRERSLGHTSSASCPSE